MVLRKCVGMIMFVFILINGNGVVIDVSLLNLFIKFFFSFVWI